MQAFSRKGWAIRFEDGRWYCKNRRQAASFEKATIYHRKCDASNAIVQGGVRHAYKPTGRKDVASAQGAASVVEVTISFTSPTE